MWVDKAMPFQRTMCQDSPNTTGSFVKIKNSSHLHVPEVGRMLHGGSSGYFKSYFYYYLFILLSHIESWQVRCSPLLPAPVPPPLSPWCLLLQSPFFEMEKSSFPRNIKQTQRNKVTIRLDTSPHNEARQGKLVGRKGFWEQATESQTAHVPTRSTTRAPSNSPTRHKQRT